MISINNFKIAKVTEGENQADFEIGPLPQGYGLTLGNILRRVLLSSIPGSAITSVKIEGADHEYSTIPGVKDDVLTILLSLKNVIFHSKSDEPVTLNLEVKGGTEPIEVTAASIEETADVEVINKHYVITTLTSTKAKFKVKLVVERGVGYRLPKEEVRQEVGMLPVDAIFSPVKLVKHSVVPTRVGNLTELDQLNMSILTNGAITPADSLNIAGSILQEMSNNFVEQTKDMTSGRIVNKPVSALAEDVATVVSGKPDDSNKLLISDLALSTRLTNALMRSGFDDLNKLNGFTEEEVANIRGMGEKSLVELLDVLKQNNIKLI